jgi:hypothetical protein
MKNTQILAAVLLAVGATTAQAGGYAGFDAGYGNIDRAAAARSDAQAAVAALGGSATATYEQSVSVGRVFAGWNVAKDLDIEVGYLKTGDLSDTLAGTTSGNVAYSLASKTNAHGVDVAAVWWINNNLFIKGGMHSTTVEATGTLTVLGTTVSLSGEQSGSGMLLGIGYESALSQNINWRAAYSYYDKMGGLSDANVDIYTLGLKMKF